MSSLDSGSLADWVSGLGSLAAVIVAMLGFWIIERHRAADRRDIERGIAYELMAALMNISNNILLIEKHFRGQRNDIDVSVGGKSVAHFKVVNPLIGFSNEAEVDLPAGTTRLLVKAEAVELWNDTILLVNHNRALTSIMKEYRDLWAETMSRMPVPQDFSGQVGHIGATKADLNAVRPDLIKIDSIVAALETQIPEAVELVKRVTAKMGPTLRRYFNEPFLHLGDSASSPEATSADPEPEGSRDS